MRLAWTITAAGVLGVACAPRVDPEREVAEARRLFEANIAAIQNKDRAAYLACYRADERLVRAGPGGVTLGFEGLASGTSDDPAEWPESLEALEMELHWIGPGHVYGAYRYRVVIGGEVSEGLSERWFRREGDQWKITVSTAFGQPGPADPRLAAVAFLTGTWSRAQDGDITEESWSPPRAGTMIGTARTMSGDRTTHWEHLRIELDGKEIVYVASPKGQATTRFVLREQRENFAAFENPAHDYPKRISYRGEGSMLHTRIEGGGPVAQWELQRR